MRQIVLDTETTGLEVSLGHRVIEIGCVELVNRRVTGNHWHHYFNPEREVDAGAFEVHGISNEFLQDKPRFADLAGEFVDYVRGAELIIHNAPFDVGFLNHELSMSDCGLSPLEDSCGILDTLMLARQKHPGQKNNLDALCKRYDIDNSQRSLHGALLDARILADVYLAMTGGQASLVLDAEQQVETGSDQPETILRDHSKSLPLWQLDEASEQANRDYVEFLASQHPDPAWK
jgi:DNA polymerase-3 subunit epsilon